MVLSPGNNKRFWQSTHIKKCFLVNEQHSELIQYENQSELPTNEVYDQDNTVRESYRAPDKQSLSKKRLLSIQKRSELTQ